MGILKHALLASTAGLAAASAAQGADLPTKTAAPAPIAANCYASFASWLDSTAPDCPLAFAGITVYGQIDVGGGYETAASRLNRQYSQGVQEVINKTNNGGRWQLVPNGLSQTNVGVKIKEQIAPNWYAIGDVDTAFDPYSLRLDNGPGSLHDNNNTLLQNQTSNADSSRAGQWDNTRGYVGLSNTTYGTLTFGRQYAFTTDAASNYDPFGGAYAFSLIGNSATALSGAGDTELARYNTSVKYQVAYNGLRAGALVQLGGWEQGNGAQSAYQFDLGGDIGGFSAEAIYAYAKDAVALSAYTSGAPTPDTLKATLADVNAGVIAARYKWQALTVYGGYEYARLSSPSDLFGATATAAGGTLTLNAGYPGVVQANAYVNPKDLQVLWTGAKYAILSNLDASVGYYREWQNNYTNAATTYNVGKTCGPNGGAKGPAIPGATPQGSNSSACAGATQAVSGLLDWRPVKRVDVYGGVMVSKVSGGMANGFIKSENVAFTSGVRVSF